MKAITENKNRFKKNVDLGENVVIALKAIRENYETELDIYENFKVNFCFKIIIFRTTHVFVLIYIIDGCKKHRN